MEVQTIRISKDISKREANSIIKKMGYKVTPPNSKSNPQYTNYHSYRQRPPSAFENKSFRTKEIKKSPHIFMILGKLKK